MLESGDSITVDAGCGNFDVDVGQQYGKRWGVDACCFIELATANPFMVNLASIDYCRGEFSEDKTSYGLRIHFRGGDTIWIGGATAQKFLDVIQTSIDVERHSDTKKSLAEKFVDQSKAVK